MAARIETGSAEHRFSFGPVMALVLLAVVVAIAYAITRPQTVPADRPQTSAGSGMDRQALVQAGFTGRLGGTTEAPSLILRHGSTGPVGETSSLTNWTQQATDVGFTGRMGGTTTPTDWRELALAAGYAGRAGA